MKMKKSDFVTFPITVEKVPRIKGFLDITKSHPSKLRYGIQTGKRNNLVVVDIDVKNNGLAAWEALKAKHPELNTVTIKTPSGGFHYYFKYKEGLTCRVGVGNMSMDKPIAKSNVVSQMKEIIGEVEDESSIKAEIISTLESMTAEKLSPEKMLSYEGKLKPIVDAILK